MLKAQRTVLLESGNIRRWTLLEEVGHSGMASSVYLVPFPTSSSFLLPGCHEVSSFSMTYPPCLGVLFYHKHKNQLSFLLFFRRHFVTAPENGLIYSFEMILVAVLFWELLREGGSYIPPKSSILAN